MITVVVARIGVAVMGFGDAVGQKHAVTINGITLSVSHRVPSQHHLMVRRIDVCDKILGNGFVIRRAVGETHAVASAANVKDTKVLVDLSVGKKRSRIGLVIELGLASIGTEGGSVEIARAKDAAVGAEDVHFVEDVVAVVARIAIETGVDAVDEKTAIRKTFIEHALVVTVFDDVILVWVVGGDSVRIASVAFP